MFIEDSELTEVKVYYKKFRANIYKVHTQKEMDKLALDEEKKKTYKILTAKMKELTWGLYNELQELSIMEGQFGNEQRFNYRAFKEGRLKRLLVSWDAEDSKGTKITINDNSLAKLVPDVAEALLRAYDEISVLSEEESKN